MVTDRRCYHGNWNRSPVAWAYTYIDRKIALVLVSHQQVSSAQQVYPLTSWQPNWKNNSKKTNEHVACNKIFMNWYVAYGAICTSMLPMVTVNEVGSHFGKWEFQWKNALAGSKGMFWEKFQRIFCWFFTNYPKMSGKSIFDLNFFPEIKNQKAVKNWNFLKLFCQKLIKLRKTILFRCKFLIFRDFSSDWKIF